MDFLLGLLALIVGVAVCVAGLRVFFIMLPIWGFVAGFFTGAALVTAIFGDGFLSTTLGIIVGLVFAVLFAVLSYLYWYFAVLLAFGYAGGILGASLFASFGVDSAWLLFVIAVITGALFILAAVAVQLPIVLVIVNTAMAGAAIAIAGLLLVLDQMDRKEIGTGALWQKINDNWFLWIVWIIASAIGVGVQLQAVQQANLPTDRWTRARPGLAG